MKLTFEDLHQHLETKFSVQDIADALTHIGHEVEGVQAPPIYDNIVVAHVIDVQPHPQADRLRVCTVDDGLGKPLNVVCGAPNVEKGMYGLLAREGAVIPSTGQPLKKGVIRGVASEGMMCSAEELCINIPSEKGTIIKLDRGCYTPGTPATEVLPASASLIEVSLTPNRGDCWSVHGLARDLAACGYGNLRPLPTLAPVTWQKNLDIHLEATAYFTLSELHLQNVPHTSPWKQSLEAIEQRSSHPMVDLTNYAAYMWGQPMHAFDADKLNGPLVLRLARDGETLAALDGQTYTLSDGMLVLADDQGVQALPGIIGAINSAVSEQTKRVYLEVAWFSPDVIAQAGQKLRITSDARTRFERGVDPQNVVWALQWALDACKEWAQYVGSTQVGEFPPKAVPIAWDVGLLQKHLGQHIEEAPQLLEKLGCVVKDSHVMPPSWRSDIRIPMDLVEEVARLHGYNNIPRAPLPAAQPQGGLHWINQVREVLAARNFFEVMTWSMISAENADKMGGGVPLLEPLTQDMAVMRSTLLAGLLPAAAHNQSRHDEPVSLYEWAHVYHPKEQAMLAGLRVQHRVRAHWDQSTKMPDFYTAKADVWSVLEALHMKPETFQIAPGAPEWYHPHQSCALKKGPRILGYIGTIHPRIAKHYGLKGVVVGFEFFADVLHAFQRQPSGRLPSVYQSVTRDFCFVMPHEQGVDEMLRGMVQLPHVIRADVVDVYIISDTERSVVFQVTLRPEDHTLTDAEIQDISSTFVNNMKQKWNIQLRV